MNMEITNFIYNSACHFVILMTYDYYGPWWLVTAHSAPLYNSYYSVVSTIKIKMLVFATNS